MFPSSEIDVKPEKHTAVRHITPGKYSCSSLPDEGILIVECEASAARNERIITVPNYNRVDVAEIAGVSHKWLARHADGFIPVDEN